MSPKKRASKKRTAAKKTTARSTKKTSTSRSKAPKRKEELLKKFEALLLERRQKLLQELQGGMAALQKDPTSPTGDSADVASDIQQEALVSHLAELESQELTQIDHALQRIREGTYGICEECGKEIPEARLKALPFTTLCVNCQAQYEEEYGEGAVYLGRTDWERVEELESLSEEEEEVESSTSGSPEETEEEEEEVLGELQEMEEEEVEEEERE